MSSANIDGTEQPRVLACSRSTRYDDATFASCGSTPHPAHSESGMRVLPVCISSTDASAAGRGVPGRWCGGVLKAGEPRKAADRVIGAIECAWFGETALLDDASLPLAVFAGRTTPPCGSSPRRPSPAPPAPGTWSTRGAGWRTWWACAGPGVGVSLLFAAAEDRRHLPVVPRGRLPEPARHLP
ncbi:hypothetical protein [Streptomyces misionensis]|uniref:hypothetical protein n=1 Tax=Streptomyces misionensis TaxID=67331 RepID=UPI0033A4C52A